MKESNNNAVVLKTIDRYIPDVKIGDKVLNKSTNREENDIEPIWVERVVNETYYELICEFPEDFKHLNGDPIIFWSPAGLCM